MSPRVSELYMNDVVYRFNKRRQIVFGIVLDTYEFCSPDDTYLRCKGQVRVYWFTPRGREQIVMQHQVYLLSRSVVDGDIVRRLEKGKETQRGYCRSVQLRSAVRLMGTKKVIENVDHSRFMALHPVPNTIPVCVGELFGRVISCDYIVRLKSRDGSILNYRYNNTFGALITSRFLNKGSSVSIVPANLSPIKWMKCTKMMQRNMEKLHTFHVRWIKPLDVTMNVHSVEGSYIYNVPRKDLPKLQVLRTLDITVPRFNERRVIRIEPTDQILQKWSWMAKQTLKHRKEQRTNNIKSRIKNRRNSKTVHLLRSPRVSHPPTINARTRSDSREWVSDEDEDEDSGWITVEEEDASPTSCSHSLPLKRTFVVEALCTEAKAVVVWQDGTIEEDVPTTQLYYSMSLDDHEFFPGEWVIRSDDVGMYGVVQKASYIERTALVKWFSYEQNTPVFTYTSEVSVYDIKQHPMFLFRPGGVVHRRTKCLNNVGTVVDSYPDGYVRVLWVNGEVEDCWPQQIAVLPEVKLVLAEDSDEEEAAHSLQGTWETESIETVYAESNDDTPWHLLAKRIQFIRSRIIYIKKALTESSFAGEHFSILQGLLSVYENSIYLDKLLDTQYFSIRSSHYQAVLTMIKEKAKAAGVEIQSKLADNDGDSLHQLLKLEGNLQKRLLKDATGELSTPMHQRDPCCLSTTRLCVELLSMLKCRLDLCFAEVVSHMGEPQSAWILSNSCDASPQCTGTSTPMPSCSSTPDDSLTSISNTPSKLGDCNIESWHFPLLNWSQGEESSPSTSNTLLLPIPITSMSLELAQQSFDILEEAPNYHRFYHTTVRPTDSFKFYRAVTNENKLLSESLPAGVWVYTYADRLDLYSVMIRGPHNTPYEDGLFIFDIQLTSEYPRTPPHCNYISYSSERLNPNLYVEGKVCVSLLGTWVGCGTEVWGPASTLLQLIVSLQGLILVAEPYYNEAGYEKQSKSQQGHENSRTYNELVLLLLIQSMVDLCEHPYMVFRDVIYEHFRKRSSHLQRRLTSWIDGTYEKEPEFSLLPVSKGLKLSLRSCLQRFKQTCDKYVYNN